MAYGTFARFYDRLQSEVDYRAIAELVGRLVREHGSFDEVGVDLACGTGRLTRELSALGFEMIGVDVSEEMLTEARGSSGEDITYLCQDMRELELWGAADFVVCSLDSLNHLDSPEDLRRTFERVSMYTCDGGLFIFDLNTAYKHEHILGDNVFCFEEEGLMCVWRNCLNEDRSVDMRLDFFSRRPDGAYERSVQEMTEIVFDPELVEKALGECGFGIVGVFSGFSEEPLSPESDRALYVCKRNDRNG